MTETPLVAVLPVGEIDSDLASNGLEGILQAIRRFEADVSISDPVSTVEQAVRSIQALESRKPDLLILIPLRGLSAPIMEQAGRASTSPCLILPIAGTFALASSTLAVGALHASGVPVELLYAPPGEPAYLERLRIVLRAATAFSRVRRSRIGVVGGLFPNLVSCRYEPAAVTARLGPTFFPISFDRMREALRSVPENAPEMEALQRAVRNHHVMEPVGTQALAAAIRLHMTLRGIAESEHLDAFVTECWSGFPRELGLNPCLGFIDNSYVLACEGDGLLSVSLLLARHLTGVRAYVGDIYDVDMDGIATLIHCGGPASLSADPQDVIVGPSQLAHERGFETITVRPSMSQGPGTLFRLYGPQYDQIHAAYGEVLDCEQSPNLTTRFRLAGDRWDFLAQARGNHYVVAAGDIRSELKLLCKWFGITLTET